MNLIDHWPVDRIEPYGEGGKYKVIFSEKTKPIGPVPFGDVPQDTMQRPRYTTFVKLKTAIKLTDLMGKKLGSPLPRATIPRWTAPPSPHFARKLVQAFGEAVFDVIEEAPERLLDIEIISHNGERRKVIQYP
jgi:hypothetical protein